MNTSVPPASTESRGSRAAAFSGAARQLWDNAAMLMIFVVLFVGSALFVDNFLNVVNMRGLTLGVVQVGIVSCTMLFCLASGDFDLSPGAIVALAGVLSAVVVNATGSIAIGVSAGLAVGALVGFINGVAIARLGISAMIATLATQQVARGLAFIVSGGKAVGVANTEFFKLGSTMIVGIPSPVWVMILCFAVFGFLLNKSIFGRNTLAIGGNSEAAALAGVNVPRTRIIIFTLMGLASSLAGVILASMMTSGQPNEGQGLELRAISACVLGGVSLTGGIGTISGMIVGVLIMGTVQNVMNLMNIEPFWQYVVSGLVLLAAVLLDRFKSRGVAA